MPSTLSKPYVGCQSIFDASGVEVFRGQWNPKLIFDVLAGPDPSIWAGKSVLEIAANTGGLSVEIARAGASTVTLSEPDPYRNNLALARPVLENLIEQEALPISISNDDFFACASNQRQYDIIVCLGLIYHFRYPQLMLDMLSAMRSTYLFISTQTHPGTDLALFNRASPGILPSGFLSKDIPLTGWHPTRKLFERMLEWAGFTDVISLTDGDFSQQRAGLTNSAYYRARCISPKDPNKEMRVYYPR